MQMGELFEAILGAIYLDGGYAAACRVYEHHWPMSDFPLGQLWACEKWSELQR